ncbi:GNAT family N-acetyltransferase [Streptomyces sp. MUM 203J]|uniref:GNAT family N-acetyltransferase n=1 Tax=Streptomyces sp. MUM 203J TaxID=2791990 RepID=UPI0027E4DC80|nr:GNAT family N-acetyltransferase [Streptomyces sp. MUM 203J]
MDGDALVGFVMAFFDVPFTENSHHDRPRDGLWRLDITEAHQGKGYGRFAVEAVGDEIRRRGGTRVTVTWQQGEGGPEDFYREPGFEPTGGTSDDEPAGEMGLPPSPRPRRYPLLARRERPCRGAMAAT